MREMREERWGVGKARGSDEGNMRGRRRGIEN